MNSKYSGLWAFVVFCVYILGAIGGVGYALYSGAVLIGLCVIAVAAMALPYVIKCLKAAGFIGNAEI